MMEAYCSQRIIPILPYQISPIIDPITVGELFFSYNALMANTNHDIARYRFIDS